MADMIDPRHHVSAFSATMLPERERYDAFVEEVARKACRFDFAHYGDASFYANYRAVRLGEVNFVEMNSSAATYARSRDMLSDGNDEFAFRILLTSSGNIDQAGRTLRLGDGALADNAQCGHFTAATAMSGLLIMLPRRRLLSRVPGAEDLSRSRPVDGGCVEMILLRNYLTALLQPGPVAEATLQTAGAHVLDLVALALGAMGDAKHLASAGGLRAARAHAVRRSTLAQLNNPKLSAAVIAKANAVSERYLRKLFADLGTSFSDFLIEQRLERAHQLLANPVYRNRSISEIAFEVGFSDLSHFNRRFRARFGDTPSAARAATKRSAGPAASRAQHGDWGGGGKPMGEEAH